MTGVSPQERTARARAAFPAWGALPVHARVLALRRLRRTIALHRQEIVQVLCEETGKHPLDALAGDVMVTLEQLRYYEQHAVRILRRRRIGKPAFLYGGAQFYELYEPHGVALIYAPANYPFQLAVIPAATALFAGNSVIVKCSEVTPRLAELMGSLFRRSGLPDDLVQIVDDPPPAAAAYLEARPDMLFFTGSCANGRALAARASALLIPSVLELGGKDAAVVFADCDLPRAVEGVLYGAFSNCGRVCVGTRRLYVEQSIYPAFVQALTQRAAALRLGNAPDDDLGAPPLPNTRLLDDVRQSIEQGARLLVPAAADQLGQGPIILSDVSSESPLLQNETFGPVLCVAPFRAEADAVAMANATAFALSASIWTRDTARAHRVAASLNTGSCAVNDVIRNIANPHASFGGNGQSGYGRYHGPKGLYAFSRIKSVMVTTSSRQREIHWFPFAAKTLTRLDALLSARHGAASWASALRRLLILVLLLGTTLTTRPAAADAQPHLRITVPAPKDTRGQIAYLVFASRDGFPDTKAKAVRSGFAAIAQPPSASTIDVGPLPPGHYAVTIYQDLNGNHHLDRGFLGIPKEPVGASNNPKPSFGPPHFDQCAFDITQADQTISISLVSPK